MSIRTRLSVLIGGLLSAVILSAGGALYVGQKIHLMDAAEESRRAALTQFSQACRDALLVGDALSAINAAGLLGLRPDILSAHCTDPSGRVAAHTDPARIGRLKSDDVLPDVHFPDGLVQRADLPLGRGSVTATIVWSRSAERRRVQQSLRRSGRLIGAVSLAALLAGTAGALFIASQWTGPIRRLERATRALAAGQLDHRLPPGRADELGRLAEDFNRMAVRLGELDQMKKDFVSHVSHELRSPLGEIKSFVNLITDDWAADRTGRTLDHLAIVRNNAARLEKLVNDVLDLAKIEAGGLTLDRTEIRADELLNDIALLFSARSRESGVSLSVHNGTPAQTLCVDVDKMQQVLINLVGNAFKFTPAGGSIVLRAWREGDTALLSVSDTGPGIPLPDRERVFDRFEQLNGAVPVHGDRRGTGLGLSIARGLVAAHGGTLRVTGGPPGCVMTVSLPLWTAA